MVLLHESALCTIPSEDQPIDPVPDEDATILVPNTDTAPPVPKEGHTGDPWEICEDA